AFIIANGLAIIASLALLTHLVGRSLREPVLPIAIAIAFSTESVINTLTFSNINGLLFRLLSVFLYCFLGAFTRLKETDTPDGQTPGASTLRYLPCLAIGLAIAIKSRFAPLLFLPLMRLDLRTMFVGFAVPVTPKVDAWPILPGASDYLTKLVPYLGQTRDYANSSLAGWQAYFDIPNALYWPVWLATAMAVAIGMVILLRWRTT